MRAVTATTGTGRAAGHSARAMEDDGVRSRCIVLFYDNDDDDGRQGEVVVEKKPGEVETGLVPTPDPRPSAPEIETEVEARSIRCFGNIHSPCSSFCTWALICHNLRLHIDALRLGM